MLKSLLSRPIRANGGRQHHNPEPVGYDSAKNSWVYTNHSVTVGKKGEAAVQERTYVCPICKATVGQVLWVKKKGAGQEKKLPTCELGHTLMDLRGSGLHFYTEGGPRFFLYGLLMSVVLLVAFGLLAAAIRELLETVREFHISPATAVTVQVALNCVAFLAVGSLAVVTFIRARGYRSSEDPIGKLARKFSGYAWGMIAGLTSMLLFGLLAQSFLSQLYISFKEL
jgi:hypothetical protein